MYEPTEALTIIMVRSRGGFNEQLEEEAKTLETFHILAANQTWSCEPEPSSSVIRQMTDVSSTPGDMQ